MWKKVVKRFKISSISCARKWISGIPYIATTTFLLVYAMGTSLIVKGMYHQLDEESQSPDDSAAATKKEQTGLWEASYVVIVHPAVRISIHVVLTIFIVILMYCLAKLVTNNIASTPYELFDENEEITDSHTLKVALFGDSLMNIPFSYFNLGGLMEEELETYYHQMHFYNDGINGDTISDLSLRVNEVVEQNPHAVIIQFDSDVSDTINVATYSSMKLALHSSYVEELTKVITTLQAANVEFIAVSGPILLGEGGSLLALAANEGKDSVLDDYRALNRELCENLNITYIDMRAEFQKRLPKKWFLSRYFLTIDGEHPNRYGTQIIAKVFSDVLKANWLIPRG